jgi:diguanylate cyclase (GGDEF)-like protein
VGAAHQRIGLAPFWYMGAYLNYLSFLLPRIQQLCADDPGRASDTTLALLRIVMFDMSLAIDTYIQADEQAMRAQTERLRALNRAVEAITANLSLHDSLRAVMQQGAALTGSPAAAIAFYDEHAGGFSQWFTHGLSERFVQAMSFRPGGLADQVLRSGDWLVSSDAPHSRHRLSALARAEGIRAFICLPLAGARGQVGVLYVYRADRDDFSAEETELLITFARLAAGAIDNARLYGQTAQQAQTDALTGALNRREFDERLAAELRRARRYAKTCALLLLDIDHFKSVNDTHGHPAGDAVLKELARLLQAQLRDVDCVARYGGEEFVALLPETDSQAARGVAERVRAALAAGAFTLPDGATRRVTVSIGVACFPQCADSAAALVTHADQAMYAAKQGGRNRVQLYLELARR